MRWLRATEEAGRWFGFTQGQETDRREQGKKPTMSQIVTLPAKIFAKVFLSSSMFC
jgi:hypothetical protein